MTEEQFLSVTQVAEKLSKSLSETISVSNVIGLATAHALPVCAYRHLNDEVIYLAPSEVGQFDPVKNAHPKTTLMLGFNDPESALSGSETPFTDAGGWETVESIDKLLIPESYVVSYAEDVLQVIALDNERYGKRPKTQADWMIIEEIWDLQKANNPGATDDALAKRVSRLAEAKRIFKTPEAIRKKMREIKKG